MDVALSKRSIPLLQEDNKNYILTKLGTEAWVTVYMHQKAGSDDIFCWCGLISNSLAATARETIEWELRTDQGYPYPYYYEDSDGIGAIEYQRFGSLPEGIEPLVFL